MRFLFADFVNTTLSAGVTPTQTTISVSSAANIPVKVGAVTDKNAPRGMVIRKASWKNKK